MVDDGGKNVKKIDGNIDAPVLSKKRFIEVQNIYRCFRNTGAPIEILRDVNLSLGEGDTLAIVGASGIGKSTFLHILGTLDRPDRGKLYFQGEDVLLFDNSRLARFRNKSVGFMFQFHHLLPEFSALENASMPALISGYPREKAKEAAETILVRVGLKMMELEHETYRFV